MQFKGIGPDVSRRAIHFEALRLFFLPPYKGVMSSASSSTDDPSQALLSLKTNGEPAADDEPPVDWKVAVLFAVFGLGSWVRNHE